MKITIDDVLEEPNKNIYDLVVEAMHEATREGIKANSIVINDNIVKVPESFGQYPDMICGLKTYRTSCELPKDYMFAVLHNPYTELRREFSWIPVTERLPEEDTRVLVWLLEGGSEYTRIDTDRIHKNRWVRWNKYVTHWMPLPGPPEE